MQRYFNNLTKLRINYYFTAIASLNFQHIGLQYILNILPLKAFYFQLKAKAIGISATWTDKL